MSHSESNKDVATKLSKLPKLSTVSKGLSSWQPPICLEFLQADHLLMMLSPEGSIRCNALCSASVHVLTCGHVLQYPDDRVTPCNGGCRGQHRRDYSSKMLARTDLEDRVEDFEEYPVCQDCWLKQCLIRWYYFAEDSKLTPDCASWNTFKIVSNFLPVPLYPEIVEVSREVDGKTHVWSGPESVIEWYYEHASEMMGTIGSTFVSEDDEVPLARMPVGPCFVTVVRGPERSIKETKLVPVARPKEKRKVTFSNDVRVRTIPSRTRRQNPPDTAEQRSNDACIAKADACIIRAEAIAKASHP